MTLPKTHTRLAFAMTALGTYAKLCALQQRLSAIPANGRRMGSGA